METTGSDRVSAANRAPAQSNGALPDRVGDKRELACRCGGNAAGLKTFMAPKVMNAQFQVLVVASNTGFPRNFFEAMVELDA